MITMRQARKQDLEFHTQIARLRSPVREVKKGLDPGSWTRCDFGYAASASVAETVAS